MATHSEDAVRKYNADVHVLDLSRTCTSGSLSLVYAHHHGGGGVAAAAMQAGKLSHKCIPRPV